MGCRASGHAWAADFLNLHVTAWDHLTNIRHTHPHPSRAKGVRRGLQRSLEEDSSSLGWFASSHRRNQYYMTFPAVAQCRESGVAPARTLQSSCLRDTLDSQSYSSLSEGGEGSRCNKPTPGREQTQGELSSVLQADKSTEPCAAQGNLPQLPPFHEPKAQVVAAPRSNPSAELWISLCNSKLLKLISFCSRGTCMQNKNCPASKLISTRGARMLCSGHSHLPCLQNLRGEKPYIGRQRKNHNR